MKKILLTEHSNLYDNETFPLKWPTSCAIVRRQSSAFMTMKQTHNITSPSYWWIAIILYQLVNFKILGCITYEEEIAKPIETTEYL